MKDCTSLLPHDQLKKILSKCRQDCISELFFYLRNEIEFDEKHITCMMLYHLIAHLPRFSCASCKNARCKMSCFRERLTPFFNDVPPVVYSKEGVPCLSLRAKNLSFSLWDERVVQNSMSLSVSIGDSHPERIIYDEYRFSPEALAIIDKCLLEITDLAKDAIFTASKSFRVNQIVHAQKDTDTK